MQNLSENIYGLVMPKKMCYNWGIIFLIKYSAMNVMGKTITGAASGETAQAAPKGSQSQAKGQKTFLEVLYFYSTLNRSVSEVGHKSSLFYFNNLREGFGVE